MSSHSKGLGATLEQARLAQRGPVQRALRLLEAVDRHQDGVTLDALCRELQAAPDTLRRTVALLEAEGYLQRLDDGSYALGGAIALLGQYTREQLVRTRLHARLARLRDELGAAVYFSRYRDGEVSIEAVAAGPAAPPVQEWVDFRAAAHASAVGKCLLGQLDHDGRRDHFSRHPVARLTSRTITDPDQLLHRLDRQPPTVPVLDLQEYALGTVCAAVPITAGNTVGCLATSMPVAKAHRLRRAAELLASRAAPVILAMAV